METEKMKFDWVDIPNLIYPAFRTAEDDKNGGYRHRGDSVIPGTGCSIAFMPALSPQKPWRTVIPWGFDWPGDFPDKESAKDAVEAAVIRHAQHGGKK